MRKRHRTLAYRVQTARLVLRCWLPSDAVPLTQAVAESLTELRAWLPWAANEPETTEAKAERLRGFRAQFDRGEDLLYGIFNLNQTMVLGAVGMHDRIGSGAREIGYWIRTSHARQGIATESVAALCRVGFELLKLRRLEIHCHPQNLVSAAIPRKLGFSHQVTMCNCVPTATIGPRDTQIWAKTADSAGAKQNTQLNVKAFDVAGNVILTS